MGYNTFEYFTWRCTLRNVIFVSGLLILIFLLGVSAFYFTNTAKAEEMIANGVTTLQEKTSELTQTNSTSQTGSDSDSYLTDNKFTFEDIVEFTTLPFHTDYLSADEYASYCRDLQQSGRYSNNVHVNAALSGMAYISAEELPIYEFLLGNIEADDPSDVVMSKALENTQALWDKYRDPNTKRFIVTEAEASGVFFLPFGLHQQIVSLCK